MKWYIVKDLGEEQNINAFEQTYHENEGEDTEDEKPPTCGRLSKELCVPRIIE